MDADTQDLVEQRLADLERVCRGLSHEANNWLYSLLGQIEMAEESLHQLAIALRYWERFVARPAAASPAAQGPAPSEAMQRLQRRFQRRIIRRRIEGLSKARGNAQQLAAVLQHLHMFASVQSAPDAVADLNSAVRAAASLLYLGYYRYTPEPPQLTVDLADGLPLVNASSGLLIGIILDLAASGSGGAVHVRTFVKRHSVVCEITSAGAAPGQLDAASAAARLCNGGLAERTEGERHAYQLALVPAGVDQAIRSGSR